MRGNLKAYFERELKIHEQRVQKLKKPADDKETKARNLSILKEQLTVEIGKVGLWVDKSAIDSTLSKLKTVKNKSLKS